MKGITLCADCAYYNMKKHKCTRGCKIDPDVSKGENPSFYVDCPLPDVEPVQKWIPCSERLPEIRTPVLIKCKCRYGKNVGSVKISMGMWRERLTEGEIEWLFYGNMFDKDGIGARVHLSGWDVLAWMPMPDAYEPRKEGDSDA